MLIRNGPEAVAMPSRPHKESRATMMNRMTFIVLVMTFAITLLVSGCASGDGGQVAAGILQGIGQGLSGL